MTSSFRFLLIFTVIIVSSTILKAQDTLFFKSGDKISSKILEVSGSEVKYKKENNPDGPTFITSNTDINYIRYKNGTTDTIKSAVTAPVVVIQKAPPVVKPIDLHPPIYQAGLFYRYDNRRIKRREMQTVLLSVHDPEINLHVRKAKTAKQLEYVGFAGIPAFAFGLGYTAVALLNNVDAAPVDQISYGPGVACIVVAAAALATSITFKIVGKKHNNAAIDIYNQKY
jgi:hypothetical protein